MNTMNRTDFAPFLTGFLRAADFAARAADGSHDWVLDWLPFAAAHGYLHVTTEEGAITGLAIGGPIRSATLLSARRPEHLRPADLDPEGDVLLGLYLFIDPAKRPGRGGRERMDRLIAAAREGAPEATAWAYWRPTRGLAVHPFREPSQNESPPEPVAVQEEETD